MSSGAACEALVDPDPQQRKKGAKGVAADLTLSTEDLLEAELANIRYCQQQYFGEEIAALSSGISTVSRRSIMLYKVSSAKEAR